MISLENTNSKKLQDVQIDPFYLDKLDLQTLSKLPKQLVTNEPFQNLHKNIPTQFIETPIFPSFATRIPVIKEILSFLANLIVALRLSSALNKQADTIGIISLGHQSGSLFCLLKAFHLLKCDSPILAYRLLMPEKSGPLKTYLTSKMLTVVNLTAAWSRNQIKNYEKVFGWKPEQFIFIPYKSNHSQYGITSVNTDDYIFSGGNSERDYKTFFEAIEGLSIPVTISVTNPAVIRGLKIPENVKLTQSVEPAFMHLMAGARIIVLCLKKNIARGSGEATFLNAMWHKKPVIVADNVAATDYIENGVDGYVVDAGNAEELRKRIVELWENPTLAQKIGNAGHEKVAKLYTHEQFKMRIQNLALVVFESNS